MDTDVQHAFQRLLASALPWIDANLAATGRARSGEPHDIRIRIWSTVFAVPTEAGRVWFKAPSPVTVHEVALYPLLVAAAPDLVLHPLAIDRERGWLLLPDGGTSLLYAVQREVHGEKIAELVRGYARLQRALAADVPTLLALGVPDMRPQVLPQRFDEAVAAAASIAHLSGDREHIDAIEHVAAMRTRFEGWCELLASGPIPPAIDHSDLHGNNILLPDGPDGSGRLYDWGDTVVAHPFSTLLNVLRGLTDDDPPCPDDPRITRVRDAYLESFTDLASRSDLIALADAACWTSIVIRTLTWVRVLELGPPGDPDWALAPLHWMKTFLQPNWLD